MNFSKTNGFEKIEITKFKQAVKTASKNKNVSSIKTKKQDIKANITENNSQNIETNSSDEIGKINTKVLIKPNLSVSALRELLFDNWDIKTVVKTLSGNIAGDNRKLRALTNKSFKAFQVNDLNSLLAKTGLNIEIENNTEAKTKRNQINAAKSSKPKIDLPESKVSNKNIVIEINKSMKVIDVINQFEKNFGKKIKILSDKGNIVSEYRRIQALTKITINNEKFSFNTINKPALEEIYQKIGLRIEL